MSNRETGFAFAPTQGLLLMLPGRMQKVDDMGRLLQLLLEAGN